MFQGFVDKTTALQVSRIPDRIKKKQPIPEQMEKEEGFVIITAPMNRGIPKKNLVLPRLENRNELGLNNIGNPSNL
jgi:hypothetical protein